MRLSEFTFRFKKSEVEVKIKSAIYRIQVCKLLRKLAFIRAPCFCPSYTVGMPVGVGSEQEWQPNRRKKRKLNLKTMKALRMKHR